MQTTRVSLVAAILALSVCGSTILSGAPMGPPLTLLREGQWSLGAEFARERMDMEAYGRVTDQFADFWWTQAFEIRNLTSNMFFGTLEYGLGDNWSVFARLGAANARDDITLPPPDAGVEASARDRFSGNYGFAWGVGTRTTFCRWGPWSFGGLMQVTWLRPGRSSFATIDPLIPDAVWQGNVELQYWQTQVSLAAAYQVDTWQLWAGPFLQFIRGDMDFDGQVSLAGDTDRLTWRSDLSESSQIGVHLGASWDFADQWNLWAEGQITGDSWLVGVGLVFMPEAFGF